ncbi:peptidase [Gordonia sp. PP30]|uniref:NTF2-like N-terminal transpeptidase domain-containing protein n=1 Tax=unclassified Gordonia (in: high G+C Gram-positive bacteria) TaxID=2657482 RepID=UPI002000366C|nr:NTF2-like N-terminal transpeptidase domain-containing protein [Gordonia sp. PP30]UQE74902.1 peptidase [Gordonia sp. PP30]
MSLWSRRSAMALFVSVVCVLSLAACGGEDDSEPAKAARAFAKAFSSQEVQATSDMTTSPSQAADSLSGTFAGMHARTVDAHVLDTVEYSDGTGSFTMRTTWRWADDREFSTKTSGSLRRLSTGWKVQWESGLLHTGMPVGGRLQMIRTDATPAPTVRSASGKAFMQMQPVNEIVINPAATRNLQRSVNSLADALKPIAPLITAQVINDKIAAAQGGETVAVTLRDPDMKVLAFDPERIAGVTVRKTGMLVMSDRRLSTPLSTGLTNYWQAIRDATSGWQVQQAAPGAAPVKLAGEQGRAGPDIMTTINQNEQLTLGDAAVEVAQPATIMTLDARSGAILAMAQNDAAADKRVLADVAYPTGSTLDPVFGALDATQKSKSAATEQLNRLGLGITVTVPGVVAPRDESRPTVSAASFRPQDFTATMLNMGTLGVSVARSIAGTGESVPPFLIKGTPTKVTGGKLGAMDADTARRIAAAMVTTAKTGDASDLTGAPGLRALVGTNGPQGPGWFVGISGGKVLVVYCEGAKSGTAALQVAQKYYRIDN